MRGRLIQRFHAVLYRLDATAMAAVAGGGYDAIWGWPKPVVDATQVGAPSRRERAAVRVPCQIDRPRSGKDEVFTRGGHELRYDYVLTMHEPDLLALGLIDTDGRPAIYAGDRVGALETLDGTVMQTFANPPGLYVVGCERAGHGLNCFGAPRNNLVFVYCEVPRTGSA